MSIADQTAEVVEDFEKFLREYYADDVAHLAQHYADVRSLYIEYGDLYQYDPDLASDWLTDPEQFREYAESALRQYDLPADISLSGAHVRLTGLDDDLVRYPGGFSPDERAGEFLAIEGQVSKTTSVYATLVEAAFECQRCGTPTYIAQMDDELQEPHECAGCERQGPFKINFDDSDFVRGQKLRVEEPPEVVKGGEAGYIDVFVEDDLCDEVTPGDKAVISGTVHLDQKGNQKAKKNRFEPYLEAAAIELRDTEFEDIDISDEDEARIHELAESGDIYDMAVNSIAPGVKGHEKVKLSLFLQLVSGVRTRYPDDTVDRGDTHILMIGDPGTAKSSLMDAVEELAPRSVSVSGEGASKSGITAAAVRDDFAENGEWTLEAGALVQAHKGVACVDELDKVPGDVAESMHRAMAQQRIPINKAGINTTLPAETAILAAANPEHGRWDDTLEEHAQITLSPTLLSRFGLIWKFDDRPDFEDDLDISDHITLSKETAKKLQRSDIDVDEESARTVEPEIEHDLLRKYIAYAKREIADPVMNRDEVRTDMIESFVSLRGANGYDPDAAVPVTFRKLEDVHRLAEAAARAELSEVVTERHVEIAQDLIGESMRQFGVNEEGEFDADVVESGTSKTQQQRIEHLEALIIENQPDEGGLALGTLANIAEEEYGYDSTVVENEIEQMMKKGLVYEPSDGAVRVWT